MLDSLQLMKLLIIIGKSSFGEIPCLKLQENWIWEFPILGLSMNKNGKEKLKLLRISRIYLKTLDPSHPLNTLIVVLNYGELKMLLKNKLKWKMRIGILKTLNTISITKDRKSVV